MLIRSFLDRLVGALLPVVAVATETASLAKATNRSVVGSPGTVGVLFFGPREERAKSTVVLEVASSAEMPALEPFGRLNGVVAPVLVTIGEVPVASQLYRRGRVLLAPRNAL